MKTEMEELREYLQTTAGGLRDDRSTESYALEFLKTERANLTQALKRGELALALNQMEYFAKWTREMAERIGPLIDEIKRLPHDTSAVPSANT